MPVELHLKQYLDDFAGWASSRSVADKAYLVFEILCRELGVKLQDNRVTERFLIGGRRGSTADTHN